MAKDTLFNDDEEVIDDLDTPENLLAERTRRERQNAVNVYQVKGRGAPIKFQAKRVEVESKLDDDKHTLGRTRSIKPVDLAVWLAAEMGIHNQPTEIAEGWRQCLKCVYKVWVDDR